MRWGYTARKSRESLMRLGVCPRIDDLPAVRHAWDGRPAASKRHPIHAICGAALVGLGPRDERFDPAHPRTCTRCVEQADTFDRGYA